MSEAERLTTRLRFARTWGEDEVRMMQEALAAAHEAAFREGAEAAAEVCDRFAREAAEVNTETACVTKLNMLSAARVIRALPLPEAK